MAVNQSASPLANRAASVQLPVSIPSERQSPVPLVAKIISAVLSPPFTFLMSAFLLAYSGHFVTQSPLMLGLVLGGVGGVLPLVVLLGLKKRGTIDTLDLSSLKERVIGFVLAFFFGCCCLFLVDPVFFGPEAHLIQLFLLSHLVITALFLVSTVLTMPYNWKISVHAGGAAYMFALTLFAYSPESILFAFLSLVLVCWSRLYLDRHTLSQVITGALASSAILLSFIG